MNKLLENMAKAEANEDNPNSTAIEDAAAVKSILGASVVSSTGNPLKNEIEETVTSVKPAENLDVLEVVYATRRGGGMVVPVNLGSEGTVKIDFTAGAVTLKGRMAKAMREEYQRNEHLRRHITEISASDRDTIMKLNKAAAQETTRAHRGVGSAAMGRPENAAHQQQMDRTAKITSITNKTPSSITPLGG